MADRKSKEEKVPQDRQTLLNHLNEQLDFLKRSVRSFDEGHTSEAKRIAVTLRVLFHKTQNSHALLEQLGMMQRNFHDTNIPFDAPIPLPHLGLVGTEITTDFNEYSAANFFARLGTHGDPKWTPFDSWWNTVVIDDRKGIVFTRDSLVRKVANEDGGAHVDPGLSKSYERLKSGAALGITFSKRGSVNPLKGAELHSLRQIAHEVLVTLVDNYEAPTTEELFKLRHP